MRLMYQYVHADHYEKHLTRECKNLAPQLYPFFTCDTPTIARRLAIDPPTQPHNKILQSCHLRHTLLWRRATLVDGLHVDATLGPEET